MSRLHFRAAQDTWEISDLEDKRSKGNECFRKQDWRGAVTHYTNCIRASNDGEAAEQTRLLAYSNRVETYLQMGEFKRALEDSNQALQIEPGHLKTLFRKGRALQGLEDYAQACQVLQAAVQLSPGQAEIDAALRRSRDSCARSRQGEYDISGFLLEKEPAGQVGEFIGDVEIKMTGDGRGRGLYATKNIGTGELFLVSNAVATYPNGARPFRFHRRFARHCAEKRLVDAVIDAAKTSQKLLWQLYALDDGSERVRSSMPAMDLFDANTQKSTKMPLVRLHDQRIEAIVSRNALGGFHEYETHESYGYSGLWVLPSFINHSCIPNATGLKVGEALFLHAAKPIDKGEEITISYVDALIPLPHRETMCEPWGFKCNCRRCALEKSLGTAFKSLNQRFEALHDGARYETMNISEEEEFPTDLPKSGKFAQVYESVEKKLLKYRIGMKEEETHWVRASYVIAYWAGTRSNEFFDKTLEDPIPSGNEIMEAVINTVPCDLRALAMAARQLEGLKQWIGNEGWGVEHTATQARDACVLVFGKHSEHVIQALIQRHSKTVIF